MSYIAIEEGDEPGIEVGRSPGSFVSVGPDAPVLRFGATGPRLSELAIVPVGERTQSLSRIPIQMRTGTSIFFIIFNSAISGSGGKLTPPTAIDIVGISLYLNGGSTTPVFATFGGNRGITIPAGGFAVTNEILPSQFLAPMTQFTRGDLFWWHESRLLPSNSGRHLVGPTATYSGAEGDAFFAICTPANYTNQVDTAGNMTVPTGGLVATDFIAAGFPDEGETPVPSGTPANNMGAGPSVCVMTVTDPTEASILLIGPSTPSGREDTRTPAPVLAGWGFMDRAAQTFLSQGYVMQHATRSGANIGGLGANPDIDLLYQYADKLFLWVGNNGLESVSATQELARTQIILNKFGKSDTTLTLGMPRTDDPTTFWETDAGQTYRPPGAAGPSGKFVQFSRMLAKEGRAGRIKNILPIPGMRSPNDILHWFPNTPAYTPDGLHFSPTSSASPAATDVEDVYSPTYSAWPDRQRQYAMACVQRPPRDTADVIAQFQAATDALGITLFAAWAFNVPVPVGDTGQIRCVDANGTYWPMMTNPSSDPSQFIDYSIYGTRAGSTTYGYLRPLLIPNIHFTASMATKMAFMIDVADCADLLSIFATAQTGGADTFVFTPYNSPSPDFAGVATVRLNSGISYNFPTLCKTGLYTANLGDGQLELFRGTTLIGSRAQVQANRAGNGLRMWNQIGGGPILSRRGTRFFCIVAHTLTTEQQAGLAAAAQEMIDYFESLQVPSGWHPLALPYFETVEDVTGSPLSDAQKTWVNDLLVELEDEGFLDVLDYLSIHHLASAGVGLLNIIRPRSLSNITNGYGSIDFIPNQGSRFTTDAIVSMLGPSNGNNGVGLHLQQNSHTMIWRGEINGQSNPIACGSNELGICPRNATSANEIAVRSASITAVSTLPTGSPLTGAHTISVDRDSPDECQIYADGVAQGTPITQASVAFSTASPIDVGQRSGGGGPGLDTVQRVRYVLAGSSLGSAGQAAIHAILEAADASMP